MCLEEVSRNNNNERTRERKKIAFYDIFFFPKSRRKEEDLNNRMDAFYEWATDWILFLLEKGRFILDVTSFENYVGESVINRKPFWFNILWWFTKKNISNEKCRRIIMNLFKRTKAKEKTQKNLKETNCNKL